MAQGDFRLIWLFTRVIEDLLHDVPRQFELSPVQFAAMRYVDLHEQPNLGAIAEALAVSNAAATKLVDRLVRRGYMRRAEGAVDRRARQLSLTPEGAALLAAAADETMRRMEEILDRLPAEIREDLRRGLEGFLAAALRTPEDVRRICLRCGREHMRSCPGDRLYEELGGGARTV